MHAPSEISSDADAPFSRAQFTTALRSIQTPARSVGELATAMRALMAAGLAELPAPGGGRTLDRWRALASVGAIDLSLAKIHESHTDALAILAELGGEAREGLWSVWAAEPPNERVIFRGGKNGGTLAGRKPWCSGAAIVEHALVSAWTESGEPILAHVEMRQPDVAVENGGWEAVGMAATESVPVRFAEARARAIGVEGEYVARPGFWQGGAGIAAVWFGGACGVAEALAASSKIPGDPHAAAHLGGVDTALRSARALLIETAEWIDSHPRADAAAPALRARASVEAAANEVLVRTGRALGPAPLCLNPAHARRCADLAVFMRQSHAESDLAALGELLANQPAAWDL